MKKKWTYWNLKQIDKKIKNEARLTKMGVKYIRKYKVFKNNTTRAVTTKKIMQSRKGRYQGRVLSYKKIVILTLITAHRVQLKKR